MLNFAERRLAAASGYSAPGVRRNLSRPGKAPTDWRSRSRPPWLSDFVPLPGYGEPAFRHGHRPGHCWVGPARTSGIRAPDNHSPNGGVTMDGAGPPGCRIAGFNGNRHHAVSPDSRSASGKISAGLAAADTMCGHVYAGIDSSARAGGAEDGNTVEPISALPCAGSHGKAGNRESNTHDSENGRISVGRGSHVLTMRGDGVELADGASQSFKRGDTATFYRASNQSRGGCRSLPRTRRIAVRPFASGNDGVESVGNIGANRAPTWKSRGCSPTTPRPRQPEQLNRPAADNERLKARDSHIHFEPPVVDGRAKR